ncbi:MAG: hypothetical protein FWH42_05470 [Dehalococcoidia bacterium]|nr:hypothetical protein [Dehalococcoidia bacterium]
MKGSSICSGVCNISFLPENIDKIYRRAGRLYNIPDLTLIKQLEKNAKKVITALRYDVKFSPKRPDVFRIERVMLAELNHEKLPKSQSDRLLSIEEQFAAAAEEAAHHNEKLANRPSQHRHHDIER